MASVDYLEEYIAAGLVKAGKFKAMDRAEFERAMSQFDDGVVCLRISKSSHKAIRSLRANNYLWRVLTMIATRTGNDVQVVHDEMCEKFLKYTVNHIDVETGEVTMRTFIGGTSKLHGDTFYEFVENVRLWAAEWLQLEIPNPDRNWWKQKKAA